MFAILLSFCVGAAVALVAAAAAVRLYHQHETARQRADDDRASVIRAELVEDEMRALLGAPTRPYFTAQAVAEARRALEPMVVIKVKP